METIRDNHNNYLKKTDILDYIANVNIKVNIIYKVIKRVLENWNDEEMRNRVREILQTQYTEEYKQKRSPSTSFIN